MKFLGHFSVFVRRGLARFALVLGVLAALGAGTARANVALVLNNLDGPGEGLNDPVLGSARLSAMNYALGLWSQMLLDSYVGETITINAQFNPLGGDEDLVILGGAAATFIHANFGGASMFNTWYGSALANHLAGFDLQGDNEITAVFNTDVDGAVVLGNDGWYYGTDGNPSGGDIDFVSVVLHEVGHGLNFFDLIEPPEVSGGPANPGSFPSGIPGIYDRFLIDAPVGGTPLTDMTDVERAAAIESDSLYWFGPGGVAGNGGVRPKMYAPDPYENGSSVSHLDELTYGSFLMSNAYNGPNHVVSALERGMFEDMGWTIVPEPGSVWLLASAGLIVLLHARRRRVRRVGPC